MVVYLKNQTLRSLMHPCTEQNTFIMDYLHVKDSIFPPLMAACEVKKEKANLNINKPSLIVDVTI